MRYVDVSYTDTRDAIADAFGRGSRVAITRNGRYWDRRSCLAQTVSLFAFVDVPGEPNSSAFAP